MKRKPEPELSEDQKYCVSVLAEWMHGEHHLGKIKPWGPGIAMTYMGDLSTYDFDGMTRLVLLAHARCVRLSVKAASPREVYIIAHRRNPTGDNYATRHPDLAALMSKCAAMQKGQLIERRKPVDGVSVDVEYGA